MQLNTTCNPNPNLGGEGGGGGYESAIVPRLMLAMDFTQGFRRKVK